MLPGRDDAAERDLEGDPERLSAGRGARLARELADDVDVSIPAARMDTGRIRDGVDVDACDVESTSVGDQLRDGAARRLNDHDRMVRVERLQLVVRPDEPAGADV